MNIVHRTRALNKETGNKDLASVIIYNIKVLYDKQKEG